jgi:hypothetical protein
LRHRLRLLEDGLFKASTLRRSLDETPQTVVRPLAGKSRMQPKDALELGGFWCLVSDILR